MDFSGLWSKVSAAAQDAQARASELATEGAARAQVLAEEGQRKAAELASEAREAAENTYKDARVAASALAAEVQEKGAANVFYDRAQKLSLKEMVSKQFDMHGNESELPDVEELMFYGISQDILDYVGALNVHTFRDFPIADGEPVFKMTEWQEKHCKYMLMISQELNDFRYVLVPRRLTDERFWKVYYLLVSNQMEKELEKQARLLELEAEEDVDASAGDATNATPQALAKSGSQELVDVNLGDGWSDADDFFLPMEETSSKPTSASTAPIAPPEEPPLVLPGPPSPIATHAADAPSMADASPLDQGPAIKSSPATTKKEVSKKGAGKGDSVKSSKGKNNRKEGGGDDTAQSAVATPSPEPALALSVEDGPDASAEKNSTPPQTSPADPADAAHKEKPQAVETVSALDQAQKSESNENKETAESPSLKADVATPESVSEQAQEQEPAAASPPKEAISQEKQAEQEPTPEKQTNTPSTEEVGAKLSQASITAEETNTTLDAGLEDLDESAGVDSGDAELEAFLKEALEGGDNDDDDLDFDDEDLDMDDFDKMLEGEIDGDDQADEEDV